MNKILGVNYAFWGHTVTKERQFWFPPGIREAVFILFYKFVMVNKRPPYLSQRATWNPNFTLKGL